jgi:hypothetical protein
MKLQTSPQEKLKQAQDRLSKIAGISPESFNQIAYVIEQEAAKLGVSAASLSATAKAVCLNSAGRFGGQAGLEQLAAFEAKKKADAAVVAGIPRESLILLKIMHGDDVVKLAAAWRAQAVTGARR